MEDNKCATTSDSKTTNMPNTNAEDDNIPKKNNENDFIEAASASASSVLKTDPIDDENDETDENDKMDWNYEDLIKACKKIFTMSPEEIEALKKKHPSLTTEEILEALVYYQDPANLFRPCTLEEIELAETFLKQTVRNARDMIDIYHDKENLIDGLYDIADFKELEEGLPALENEFGGPMFLRKIADSMNAKIVDDDYYNLTKALYECLVQEARERMKNVDELLEKCKNYITYPEQEFLVPPPLSVSGVAAG